MIEKKRKDNNNVVQKVADFNLSYIQFEEMATMDGCSMDSQRRQFTNLKGVLHFIEHRHFLF